MPRKVRVGVIGTGNMGRHHARNYQESPNAILVAIADKSSEAEQLAIEHDVPFYQNFKTMIEQEKIEAVSIAIPTPYHYEVASQTLLRGVHTLLEKPIATTIDEAVKLTQLAHETETILTIGHVERYNPLVQEIRRILITKKLGRVISIFTTRIGGLPVRKPETDVVSDLAIHDIDIIRFLLASKLELVGAVGSRTYHDSEIDSAEILLASAGASGMIQANWVTPDKIRDIRITGEGGYLRGNYLSQDLEFLETSEIVGDEDFQAFVNRLGNPRSNKIDIKFAEPLKMELEAFIGSVLVGQSVDLVPAEEATDALEIAIKARDEITRRQNHGF